MLDEGKITDTLIADAQREAEACERSVMRRLLGLRVRGRVAKRIDRVLADRGVRPVAADHRGGERG